MGWWSLEPIARIRKTHLWHDGDTMNTYDRADWHSGADNYPADLPPEAAGTHIGMFLAWAILRDRIGGLHLSGSTDALLAVRRRQQTGRDFLYEVCDGKFSDEDLSDEGNALALVYYQDGAEMINANGYLADYESTLGAGLEDLYRVADTWENFDALARVIDRRFEEWRRKRGLFAPRGSGGSNYWKIVGGGP
jgi:hypothetical protein